MPSRPAITVLLITRSKVHRADFASASHVPVIAEFERSDAPDLASTLEATLLEGPPVGKKTFVLATDFWLQSTSLPASRAAGMNDADIAAGLNFEAEVLSGLPALESASALAALPSAGGERRFLLLQIPYATRDSIDRVLAERGSKLGGLAHPAALPRALVKSDVSLQRLELWPDLAVGLRSGTLYDAQVSNADPSTGRWLSDLSEWAGEEALLGPGVSASPGVRSIELKEPERFSEWFSGWIQELTSKRSRCALITPPVKPTSPAVRLALAGLFTLAAAGLVYFVFNTGVKQPLAEAKARSTAAKDATKQFADLQTREADERKKAEASLLDAAKFQDLTAQVEAQQTRFSRLLVTLAAEKPTDLMIRSIEATGGEPKVLGTALRPEMADAFARSLSPRVRELGWEVQSPRKTAMKLTADGGPWAFEIDFHRVPEAAAPDAKNPRLAAPRAKTVPLNSPPSPATEKRP